MTCSRLRDERGQAFVLVALTTVMLLGMAAFVLDVGSWYRTHRQLQATADASALAGAQMLPDNPGSAKTTARSYADKNGGNVLASNIVVSSTYGTNDTIRVKAAKNEEGIFSKVLSIADADIDASAKARVDNPMSVLHVAPMVVHCNHPLIQKCNSGSNLPQFNVSTTLDYDPMGAPGAFGMLNLSKGGGTPGTDEEADWILHGYSAYLDVNKDYKSDPGAKFSSSQVQDALQERLENDPVLLFPVFKTLTGTGQNADYYIIGWIGFHITGYVVHGNNATLTGYFTTYIAQGILASGGPSTAVNYGVKSIQLIE
jgi:Flp pilus assembly protein TadG